MRSPSLKFPKGEVKILIPATEPESPLDNGQLLPLITDQVGNEVRKAKTREYHESDSCGSRAGPASLTGRAIDTLNLLRKGADHRTSPKKQRRSRVKPGMRTTG